MNSVTGTPSILRTVNVTDQLQHMDLSLTIEKRI